MQPHRAAILIAEDDPESVCLLKRAFASVSPDTHVTCAVDGVEVLTLLQGKDAPERHAPAKLAVLLLNLKMPRMDGFEVMEWLQHAPALRPRWVAVFSASGQSSDIETARRLGADFYLVKPTGYPEFQELARSMSALAHTGHLPATRVTAATLIFQLHSL